MFFLGISRLFQGDKSGNSGVTDLSSKFVGVLFVLLMDN